MSNRNAFFVREHLHRAAKVYLSSPNPSFPRGEQSPRNAPTSLYSRKPSHLACQEMEIPETVLFSREILVFFATSRLQETHLTRPKLAISPLRNRRPLASCFLARQGQSSKGKGRNSRAAEGPLWTNQVWRHVEPSWCVPAVRHPL